MKKISVLLLALAISTTLAVSAKADKAQKQLVKTQKQIAKEQKRLEKKAIKDAKLVEKQKKANKDVLKDEEYKAIKTQYFAAEGYGDVYNCKVAKQRFCKVKDLNSGLYVLCDRETSRTQMESAKIFYKLGRCVKLN